MREGMGEYTREYGRRWERVWEKMGEESMGVGEDGRGCGGRMGPPEGVL